METIQYESLKRCQFTLVNFRVKDGRNVGIFFLHLYIDYKTLQQRHTLSEFSFNKTQTPAVNMLNPEDSKCA